MKKKRYYGFTKPAPNHRSLALKPYFLGLNVPNSNCHNLLGYSAIGISCFKKRLYGHFQRVISPLLIRIFQKGFLCMKGYIFYYNDNLFL